MCTHTFLPVYCMHSRIHHGMLTLSTPNIHHTHAHTHAHTHTYTHTCTHTHTHMHTHTYTHTYTHTHIHTHTYTHTHTHTYTGTLWKMWNVTCSTQTKIRTRRLCGRNIRKEHSEMALMVLCHVTRPLHPSSPALHVPFAQIILPQTSLTSYILPQTSHTLLP